MTGMVWLKTLRCRIYVNNNGSTLATNTFYSKQQFAIVLSPNDTSSKRRLSSGRVTLTPKGLPRPSALGNLVGNCWPNRAEFECGLWELPLDTAVCRQRTRPKRWQPDTMMSATSMKFPSTQHQQYRYFVLHDKTNTTYFNDTYCQCSYIWGHWQLWIYGAMPQKIWGCFSKIAKEHQRGPYPSYSLTCFALCMQSFSYFHILYL